MIYKPYQYQAYATDWIINKSYSALFLDMGMGKTASTLTAIDLLLYDYFDIAKVLIIAPLRVAEETWSEEISKWDHLKHLMISKILGTEQERSKALHAKAEIYIINRENVVWLIEQLGAAWSFDMIVIDELSSFKSPKAKRFKALRKVRPKSKRVVGLTGTPTPNGLIDLWPQIYLLDQGQRLGKTITSYREVYFEPDRRNQTTIFSYKPKKGSEKVIQEKLSDICVSMKAEDYLELPEKINNFIPVHLPKAVLEQYKNLEKDLLISLCDSDIVAGNAAVLTNKLLQMANGAIYDENGEVVNVHDEKLRALDDVIEAANEKPILVFYNFKHDLKRLCAHLHKHKVRVLKTSKDIKDWNEGKIPILLVHPASAGHGLNLQAGGNIIVWFGLTWSLELYQQANGRLHRQGQLNNVIIHHLIAKGTVDEDVMKALERKCSTQDELLKAIKARLEGYKRRLA